MISSFTGRKSVAVGIIVLGYLMSESIANFVLYATDIDLFWNRIIVFLSPTTTVTGLVGKMWDVTTDPMTTELGLAAPIYGGVMAAIILICFVVMYFRYVPNE
jgi:hypothetical protein